MNKMIIKHNNIIENSINKNLGANTKARWPILKSVESGGTNDIFFLNNE